MNTKMHTGLKRRTATQICFGSPSPTELPSLHIQVVGPESSSVHSVRNTATNHVVYRDSTNDGFTWGAEQAGVTQDAVVNTCTGIAPRSTTDLLFASYAFPQAASLIYRSTFSAGSWSAIASVGPASPSWGAIRGLDCDNSKSPSVVIAGVKLRNFVCGISAAACTFDSTTWSPWSVIAPMDTGDNGLSYPNPAVHYNPADLSYYVAAIRHDDGSISGQAVDYATLYKSSDGITWQLVQSLTGLQNESHGIFANSVFYAFDGAGVFNGPVPIAPSDLSGDLLSLQIHESSDASTRFTFRLANQNGKYNALPNLRDNAQLSLSLGYNGSSVLTHVAFIDALEYVCLPDSSELRVYARDLTKFLDQICTVPIHFSMVANTTNALTFHLRVGLNNGNVYINQSFNGRRLGGTLASTLSVMEIAR